MKYQSLFSRLEKSTFRSRFHLSEDDQKYVYQKGMNLMKNHAIHFVEERLAPAYIQNDGKQTPMKGHPIFIGQHATACCCRGCLEKWHHIPNHRPLTKKEQEYIVDVLMTYLEKEMEDYHPQYEQLSLF